MNDTKHWVLWIFIVDPQSVQILSVHHSEEDAAHALSSKAQAQAAEANQHRADTFAAGRQVGRLVTPDDFAFRYSITEVGK